MHQREHDHEEILRRALRSAADLVEPSADGLERIRARLTPPRPTFLAWVIVGYSEAVKPLFGYLEPLLEWLRAALGPIIERFRPARPDAAHPQRRYAWLRPAAAMATAAFVVAMGAFALTKLPQVISQSNALIQPLIGDASGSQGGSANPLGSGSQVPGGAVPPGASGGSQTGVSQQTPGCTPSKGASTGPSASPSTSASSPSPSTSTSPSPSPSTTPSPTSTDSTTPSPTDSTSPNPAGATPSPVAPPAAGAPTTAPDPAGAVRAAVPAGATPSPSSTGTDCKSTSAPIKTHISTQPGSGLTAISHAKARQGT